MLHKYDISLNIKLNIFQAQPILYSVVVDMIWENATFSFPFFYVCEGHKMEKRLTARLTQHL